MTSGNAGMLTGHALFRSRGREHGSITMPSQGTLRSGRGVSYGKASDSARPAKQESHWMRIPTQEEKEDGLLSSLMEMRKPRYHSTNSAMCVNSSRPVSKIPQAATGNVFRPSKQSYSMNATGRNKKKESMNIGHHEKREDTHQMPHTLPMDPPVHPRPPKYRSRQLHTLGPPREAQSIPGLRLKELRRLRLATLFQRRGRVEGPVRGVCASWGAAAIVGVIPKSVCETVMP